MFRSARMCVCVRERGPDLRFSTKLFHNVMCIGRIFVNFETETLKNALCLSAEANLINSKWNIVAAVVSADVNVMD